MSAKKTKPKRKPTTTTKAKAKLPPPFAIAGIEVAPGTRARVEIPVARLVTQTHLNLPVTIVHGTRAGPRLWLSAALHGDELNGAEIIRRVLIAVEKRRLRGTLVAVPIINIFGFLFQSRYLPDRRDLNRSFPGSMRGSLAARLACLVMTEIVDRCTHGIDLHTGSNHRTNMPQLRCDLDQPEVLRCAEAFGAPLMIHAPTIPGSLRHAARERDKPILVYEAGEPLRFDENDIRMGVRGVLAVMGELKMFRSEKRKPNRRAVVVRKTAWVRANRSGIAHLGVGLRDTVEKGQKIVTMRDAFGDEISAVRSSLTGIVIGLNRLPLVNRGEALVHVAEL